MFGQNLSYDSNGNIATQQWTQNGNTRTYTYGYDGLERLKSAAYSGSGNFATAYTYDKNGNMKTLQRYNGSLMDNLTYTLIGNRVTKVEDATGNTSGFKNGSTATTEYTYDNNGNLKSDLNKGISNITYNCLNLPSVVTFSNGNTVTYTYASDGRKLRTAHKIGGTTTTTDYARNVIYENGVQKKLLTEEGYVDISVSTPVYYYYLKDHQGNNRVVVNGSGAVTETNHYYPFGGTFASGTVQPYKYNGKELDTKAGLNWYDYGARHYDAALGRFTTQDPLAEKDYLNSPYNYCGNSPMNYIDPTGKMKVIYNPDGSYKETKYNNWFHNTFIGRREYIDYGDRMVELSEKEFWQWQETGKYDNIRPMDDLSSFEMWLDEPSEDFVDGAIKFLASEVYSIINSPSVVLTGKTFTGAYQTPTERMEGFIGIIEMLPMTKTLKLTHPGTSKNFYKKYGENYFTRKKYKQKVKQYKDLNKNNKAFQWIIDFYNPLNETTERED